MLLVPYISIFYKNTIQHLILYGDHFLFEDAIGRVKRLPCAQFQHWNVRGFFININCVSNVDLDILQLLT
jgi:hypothetical protein